MVGEVALLRLAARQEGVVSREQALGLLGAQQVKRRIRAGRWQRLQATAYRVEGSPRSWRQQLVAVALWLQRGYAFSHHAAAALFRLRHFEPGPIVVSVDRHVRAAGEVVVHRLRSLSAKDLDVQQGLRVTSLARTVCDLSAELDRDRLRAMVDETLSRRWMTVDRLEATVERLTPFAGVDSVRWLLQLYRGGDGPTESELEVRVRALLEEAEFPKPRAQRSIRIHGRFRRLDFVFEPFGVVLEADGYAYHSDLTSFEKDRQRINSLTARGYVVLHWTWKALQERPRELLAELRAVLLARGWGAVSGTWTRG